MEIRAFYGESGVRNFEARNYMEKLDLDKLWIWRIYGDLDLVILKLQALKVFKYIPCAVVFFLVFFT